MRPASSAATAWLRSARHRCRLHPAGLGSLGGARLLHPGGIRGRRVQHRREADAGAGQRRHGGPRAGTRHDRGRGRPALLRDDRHARRRIGRGRCANDATTRGQTMPPVEDLVEQLLSEVGPDTYVIFTSDNGFHRRRLPARASPTTRTPWCRSIVWGPDVVPGVDDDHIVANIDLAPTIADWAGVTPPAFVDGSLAGAVDEGSRALVARSDPAGAGREPGRPIRTKTQLTVDWFDGRHEVIPVETSPRQERRTATPAPTERAVRRAAGSPTRVLLASVGGGGSAAAGGGVSLTIVSSLTPADAAPAVPAAAAAPGPTPGVASSMDPPPSGSGSPSGPRPSSGGGCIWFDRYHA